MGTTYETLGSYTVSGTSTSSVTFSSLGSFTDLVVTGTHAQNSDNQSITAYYNSDTGNNYAGNSVYTYYSTNYFIQGDATNSPGSSAIRNQAASGYTSAYGNWGSLDMYITEYRNNKWKNTLYRNTTATDNGSYFGTYISIGGTTWKNTAAITSITLTATGIFTAGTVFSLYGITAG